MPAGLIVSTFYLCQRRLADGGRKSQEEMKEETLTSATPTKRRELFFGGARWECDEVDQVTRLEIRVDP